MAKFLKWLLSLFVTTTVTTQVDADGDKPDCPEGEVFTTTPQEVLRDQILRGQLQIDALKYEGARRLLERLDD